MQFTDTFELSVKCAGLTFCEVEAEVTISCQDDGCGDLSWHVSLIEVENLSGTGWLRWDHKDTTGTDFYSQLGNAFFKAALSDEIVDEAAADHWREAMMEAA